MMQLNPKEVAQKIQELLQENNMALKLKASPDGFGDDQTLRCYVINQKDEMEYIFDIKERALLASD